MTMRKAILMLLVLGASVLWLVRSEAMRDVMTAGDASGGTVLRHAIEWGSLKRFSVVTIEHGGWGVLAASELSKREDGSPPPPLPKTPFGDPVRWVLRRPEGAPVDEEKLQTVVRALNNLSVRNTVEGEETDDEATYGLEPPQLVVTAEDAGGKQVLTFGHRHSISGRRYVQREDDGAIFLTDDAVFSLLNVSADTIRDLRPFRFDPAKVRTVTLVQPKGQALVLDWVADGRWTVTEQEGKSEADTEIVMSLLRTLGQMRVRRFVDETPETLAFFGLTVPRVVVGIVLDRPVPDTKPETVEGTRVILQVGEGVGSELIKLPEAAASAAPSGAPPEAPETPKLASYIKAVGTPTIFELMQSVPSDLFQDAEHFRVRRPFDVMDPEGIAKIVLTDPTRNTTVERRQGGWFAGAGQEARRVDETALRALLESIKDFRVLSYLKPEESKAAVADRPLMELEIWPRSSAAPHRFSVGSEVQRRGSAPKRGEDTPPRYFKIGVQMASDHAPRTRTDGSVVVGSAESWKRIAAARAALLSALDGLKRAD